MTSTPNNPQSLNPPTQSIPNPTYLLTILNPTYSSIDTSLAIVSESSLLFSALEASTKLKQQERIRKELSANSLSHSIRKLTKSQLNILTNPKDLLNNLSITPIDNSINSN